MLIIQKYYPTDFSRVVCNQPKMSSHSPIDKCQQQKKKQKTKIKSEKCLYGEINLKTWSLSSTSSAYNSKNLVKACGEFNFFSDTIMYLWENTVFFFPPFYNKKRTQVYYCFKFKYRENHSQHQQPERTSHISLVLVADSFSMYGMYFLQI